MKWKQQQQQQQQQVWGRRNWGKIGLPAVFLLCSLFFVAGLFGSSFLSHDMPSIKSPPRLLESNQEEDPISSLAHDSDDDLNDSKKNPHDGDDDNNNDRDLDNYKMKKPHDGDDDNIHDLDNYKMKKPHDGDDDNIHDLDNYKMAYGLTGEPNIDSIPFQVLSWKPRALYFPNFATADQCRSIIDMAKTRLKPSKLALRKGETAASTKGIRTSSGTFVSASEDSSGVLEAVEYKIARACMIPRSHGEAFNILRYKIGQRYVSHYDAFNPAEYGPQKSQRMASFLLYLSDVEEGGETMFPFENGANMDIGYDYEKCIGLKVKPRRGDGLLFYSLLPNGIIDQTSLHGSCPVIKGEKWVATKWIRDQHQNNS